MTMTPEARKALSRTVRGLRRGADDPAAYTLLLRLVMLRLLAAGDRQGPPEELAAALPGLFFVPVPSDMYQHIAGALGAPELASCWTDDMTLGWVHQSWNDPDREALDARLHARARLGPDEIASKTQVFSERYMVDWLLHNSLGPLWLAICEHHGWTADVVADGTLDRLERRRVDWRARRDRGELAPTDLMPLDDDGERRWAYYVPRPLPAATVASIRDLTILDPAVGSGHFLVVAFDLLLALHREEARHRGQSDRDEWSDRAIVERIVEHNLRGIDLDPRVTRIAAAALWLKARRTCPGATPGRLNLVASDLRLAALPDDDPALAMLRRAVERDTGVAPDLTDTIVATLRDADHLGSLLRVDTTIEHALEQSRVDRDAARSTILTHLEAFLAAHTDRDDLGLRLGDEQPAAGVRFLRMLQPGRHDIIVGNPPYLGTAKLRDARAYRDAYPDARVDYFAGFFLRALELVRPGGTCAFITLSNWMYLTAYQPLRHRLRSYQLDLLADLGKAAFSTGGTLISTACTVLRRAAPDRPSLALRPQRPDEIVRDDAQPRRTHAALLVQSGATPFTVAPLSVIDGAPMLYDWPPELLAWYAARPQIQHQCPARQGMITGDNARFLRRCWEVRRGTDWPIYIKGAEGKAWIEPDEYVVRWALDGLEIELLERGDRQASRPQNRDQYFRRGVSFSMIGSRFTARAHRTPGIFGGKGSSLFPADIPAMTCMMNASRSRHILESLNPGIGFEVGDVNRLPIFAIPDADTIFSTIETAFGEHESHREQSVEFRRPGPSPWRHAQTWAQRAVDRPDGSPLPPYIPEHDPEPATDHISYALGVALGRFAPAIPNSREHALPAGVLFLDATLAPHDLDDGLGHPAAAPLLAAWAEHGPSIAPGTALRDWLVHTCFDLHRRTYENRPIHWPLSSERRTFVAWITIHRLDENTLRTILADHLHPRMTRLLGALTDKHRPGPIEKWREELAKFIADITQCAEHGPPPTDANCPPRAADARYAPDLDDGVLINSAALWPLLTPQWKDPKKWWRELATAAEHDCDWSHLAMRHWPARVDAKCRKDPSLAAAHRCLWRYHPSRAYAWELRLQHERPPDFQLREPPYHNDGGDEAHRAAFLADHADEARRLVETEHLRRRRKHLSPTRPESSAVRGAQRR